MTQAESVLSLIILAPVFGYIALLIFERFIP